MLEGSIQCFQIQRMNKKWLINPAFCVLLIRPFIYDLLFSYTKWDLYYTHINSSVSLQMLNWANPFDQQNNNIRNT